MAGELKVGIIGVGVVGGAVYSCFKKCSTLSVKAYDIKGGYDSFEDVLDSEVIFVCVPTPTFLNSNLQWEQDKTALDKVLSDLFDRSYQGIVCIKSTVLPGTTDAYYHAFQGKLNLLHNPEFLTAAKANEDFELQEKLLVGGGTAAQRQLVVNIHYMALLNPHLTTCVTPEARVTETAKYMHNVFLATKVSFCNFIYEVCERMHIPYEDVLHAATTEKGLTLGHTQVPGPDGGFGYSGMCFPKDTRALLGFCQTMGVSAEHLLGVCLHNDRIRPHDENCKDYSQQVN